MPNELGDDSSLKHFGNTLGYYDNCKWGEPSNKWHQCLKECTISKSSLSWILWLISIASIFCDWKATRCNCLLPLVCERTLSSAISNASASNIKSLARSIWSRIRVDVNTCFKISNALVAPAIYIWLVFLC